MRIIKLLPIVIVFFFNSALGSFEKKFVSIISDDMTRNAAEEHERLQREFTDLRFGAFLHFGIRTFTGGIWAEADQDISQFNPEALDCHQWAEAIAAAKMKFGILTTKHHDGFCLWDSQYTEYDVANTPWRNGKGDLIQEYTKAFRAKGLEPCLYYSIWDNTAGIGNGPITSQDMRIFSVCTTMICCTMKLAGSFPKIISFRAYSVY